MDRKSVLVDALVLVLTVAACGQVASTHPAPTSPSALAASPTQMNHGRGPFTIAWNVDRPGEISGRIYNNWQNGMASIQLLVEGLDPSNRVVSQTYHGVFGEVPPLFHRYFVLTKVPPADHYQVSVYSYQSQERPGCCAK